MNGCSIAKMTGARAGLKAEQTAARVTRDVVFVFLTETLADSCRREFCFTADQVLLALSRAEDRIGRIIVADAWRWTPGVMLRSMRALGTSNIVGDRVTHVRPSRWRRRDPVAVPALRRSYQRYDSILREHVRRCGLEDPAVVTFNPFVAAFSPLRWASSVVYYAQDDAASFPPSAPWWPAYREAYAVLRDRGTRIVCVSGELAARVAAGGPAVVVPNGLNTDEWREPAPAPAVFAKLAQPVVTYAGTIDDRLDTGLIAGVAGDPAVGSLALIGPCADRMLRRTLSAIPKVTLCGSMRRADLAGALMASDACIIPHVAGPLTRAMSPLKLYEYLAAGKPVATTDLPPVAGVSDRVISAPPAGFTAAVRAALSRPRQPERERLAFLRTNSWGARQESTIRVLLADDANWWAA